MDNVFGLFLLFPSIVPSTIFTLGLMTPLPTFSFGSRCFPVPDSDFMTTLVKLMSISETSAQL
ncbi:hypothetical protein ACLK1S_02370 [Escherichia coli]